MDKVRYEDIKGQLKTGDIILFSGQYDMSKEVEKLEKSKWSHVTMVVRLPEYEDPLLYEATALTNLPDLLYHDHITGPKVVALKERLLTYGSDLKPYVPPLYAVRQLKNPLPEDALVTIKALLKDLHGVPNPSSKRMIFEVVLGRYLHIKTKKKDITCSGFIALTYKKLGLLKSSRPYNGFIPKDFSTDAKLSLEENALGDEIQLILSKEEDDYEKGPQAD